MKKIHIISMLAIILLISIVAISHAQEVNEVRPQITVAFEEKVVITSHYIKNIDTDKKYLTDMIPQQGGRVFIFTPQKALINGNYEMLISASDLIGNSAKYSHKFSVKVPETIIQLVKPNSIGVANTTKFDVLIKTSRPSVCKYTGISVDEFGDIRLKAFDITGNISESRFETEHTINGYEAQPQFPKDLHVLCRDDLGRDNAAVFKIYSDITPPRITSAVFIPGTVADYSDEGVLEAKLRIVTSEPSLCRLSQDPNVTYERMTDFDNYDENDFDAFIQQNEQQIEFPQDTIKQRFTFYIQCRDRAGHKTSRPERDIVVDLTQGLKIGVVTPPLLSNNREITINLTTNRRAYCLYKSDNGQHGDPTSFTDPAAKFEYSSSELSNIHTKYIGTRPAGSHNIIIHCEVPAGVGLDDTAAEKSHTYIIDTTPPTNTQAEAKPACSNALSAIFSANDTNGIKEYIWSVGPNGKPAFANGTSTENSVTVTQYSNGSAIYLDPQSEYTFRVIAVDGAGNKGTQTTSNKIKYDETGASCDIVPPTVTLTKSDTGDSALLECFDDTSNCSITQSLYGISYEQPCNATSYFSNPIFISLFKTTIVCWEIYDNAGNVNKGSQTVNINATDIGMTPAQACEGGIDQDGDGYGERCLLGWDCDDTDSNSTVGCSNGCIHDLDGDGYGIGCVLGDDCNGLDADLTTDCPNGCIVDNDGDNYGLGCNSGPDCDGTDSTLQITCPNGCVVDEDGDGYGLGCPAGYDCNDIDRDARVDCDNNCIQDGDADGYGIGCLLGLDCDGLDPSRNKGCDNGCKFDEDGDDYGMGCELGIDCNGANPFIFENCPNGCIADHDGDYMGWKCTGGRECNDTTTAISADCSATTRCIFDHDGDGYGLGCNQGPDCDDYDRDILFTCNDSCTYDADCDALPDEWQKQYFNITICNDTYLCGPSSDPDEDGSTNIEEYRRGTNPLVKEDLGLPSITEEEGDADNDEMPDACERMYGLNPEDSFDAGLDNDEDTLSNKFECTYRSGMCRNTWMDPTSEDTDDDGAKDPEEIDAGTDPCDPDSKPSAGIIPLILLILGILMILAGTGYQIYKKYYIPLVSPQPKPSAPKPTVTRAGVLSAGVKQKPRPRRALPPKPKEPSLSDIRFKTELQKRAEERDRLFSAFGERKHIERPQKVMEKIARRPSREKKISIPKSDIRTTKDDHFHKLVGVIGKDHFQKLDELTHAEVDYFGKLAEIAKKKQIPVEDHVNRLVEITKRLSAEPEKKKDLKKAFETSEMKELDHFLKTRKKEETFIKEQVDAPKIPENKKDEKKDPFSALSDITKDKEKGTDYLSSIGKKKHEDVMEALNAITVNGAHKTAKAKISDLKSAESKEDIVKAFRKIGRDRHVDKNVFEVLLSYMLKSGKITKHDVSEILFNLEEQGVLHKKDVSEVFFNLGIHE